MNTLNNSLLYYSDVTYNKAINYSQSLYNCPITLNYGEKHNRTKYIISAGTSDDITILQDGIYIYILAENNPLSYISLQCFNTETKEEAGNVYLGEPDYEEGCINDMTTEEKFKYLSNWF